MLPIENTTTGGITDSYDLMVDFDNYIVGEHVLKINQALLGLSGASVDDIRTVYSHAQGILQSREFLMAHPLMQAVEGGSTADAARRVAEEGDMKRRRLPVSALQRNTVLACLRITLIPRRATPHALL